MDNRRKEETGRPGSALCERRQNTVDSGQQPFRVEDAEPVQDHVHKQRLQVQLARRQPEVGRGDGAEAVGSRVQTRAQVGVHRGQLLPRPLGHPAEAQVLRHLPSRKDRTPPHGGQRNEERGRPVGEGESGATPTTHSES